MRGRGYALENGVPKGQDEPGPPLGGLGSLHGKLRLDWLTCIYARQAINKVQD